MLTSLGSIDQNIEVGQPLVVLPTQRPTEKVKIIFSELTKKIYTYVLHENGQETPIKSEHTPKQFKLIQSPSTFFSFFFDAFARVNTFNNQDWSLHVAQRGRGGVVRPDVNQAEQKSFASETMALITKGQQELAKHSIKDNVIMLVGRTRAGKSLLSNHLSGVPIVGMRFANNEFQFDVNSDHAPLMRVSHSNAASCTASPGVHSPAGENYTYIDAAGFGDTHGPFQDIANAFFRAKVTEKVKQLKFALVVQYSDIKEGGNNFSQTLQDLVQSLGCCQDPEGAKAAAKSMVLVVTKAPSSTSEEELKKKVAEKEEYLNFLIQMKKAEPKIAKQRKKLAELKADLNSPKPSTADIVKVLLTNYLNDNHSLSESAKTILRHVLEQSQWTIFSAPQQEGPSEVAELEKQAIENLIHHRAKYLEKTQADIQVKVSDNYMGQVQLSILSLIDDLKEHLVPDLLEGIDAHFKHLFATQNEQILQKFKQKFHDFIQTNLSLDLYQFIQILHKKVPFKTHVIEEVKRQQHVLQFLINLLPEGVARNNFPVQREWLKTLGLKEPLQSRETLLTNMLSHVDSSYANGKLIMQGYFLKTSQIKEKLRDANIRGFTEIEIHALHTITIDEDLAGDELKSINLTIIAPRWEVIRERIIDLSGKNSSHFYPSSAAHGVQAGAHGTDGEPGLPGGHGGHFLGFGDQFSNIDKLTIISNGGNGGPGQQGGNGQNGSDGENGAVLSTISAGTWDYYGRHHQQGPHTQGVWPYSKFSSSNIDELLQNLGKLGQPGGNAGKGGASGVEGKAGTLAMMCLSPTDISQTILATNQKDGEPGKPGARGVAGRGGVQGRTYWGVWNTRADGWNGHHQPGHTGLGVQASNGVASDDKNITNRQTLVVPPAINPALCLTRYQCYQMKASHPMTAEALDVFRKKCEAYPHLQAEASLANFTEGCHIIEDLSASTEDKARYFPLYVSLLEKLKDYGRAVRLADNDLIQFQILYTFVLSKICHLQASMDSRLIIDIKGFLQEIQRNIEELNSLDRDRMIRTYQHEYESPIKNNIRESAIYIQTLNEDIRAAHQEVSVQITQLIGEIRALRAQGEASRAELVRKQEQLKEAMKKKAILGALSIAIQCVGCCFPPAGPIVAGIANVGLKIVANPASAQSEIGTIINYATQLEAIIRNPPATVQPQQISTLTRIKNIATTARPLLQAGVELLGDLSEDERKLRELERSIRDTDNQIALLNQYEAHVPALLQSTLQSFIEGASELQISLQDRSVIGREFMRLEVKRSFENFKKQLKESTQGFEAGAKFAEIVQQIQEAIETSMNIYDRVQDYEDRLTLADYMAKLASPLAIAQNPRLELLRSKAQRNVVLEHYSRAVAAVHQWAFPFGASFLDNIANLAQLARAASAQEQMQLIRAQLGLLQTKVNNYHQEVQNFIDQALIRAEFSPTFPSTPFYAWSGKEFSQQINDLLKGEQVILYADINQVASRQAAIKFNEIEIKFRCQNPEQQALLDFELQSFKVELHHSGQSYYRLGNQIYQMSNDRGFNISYSFARRPNNRLVESNEVYNKMKRGDLVLSPYTYWTIKLVPLPGSQPLNLFDKLKDLRADIELQLVGRGQYVDEAKTRGRLQLDSYDPCVLSK